MKTRVMTNHEKVMISLFELDPKQICFMINKLNNEKENMNQEITENVMDIQE